MANSTRSKFWALLALIPIAVIVGIFLYTSEREEPLNLDQDHMDPSEQSELGQMDKQESKPSKPSKPSPIMLSDVNDINSEPEDDIQPPPVPLADPTSFDEVEPNPDESSIEGPFADSNAVLSQETMKVDPPMMDIGKAWREGQARNDFSMPVASGRDLEIEVERFESIGEEGGVFVGKVKGHPDSSVRLSYRGAAEAGTIRLPSENREYRIFPSQSGTIVVQERDIALDDANTAAALSNVDIPPVPNFIPPPPPDQQVEAVQE